MGADGIDDNIIIPNDISTDAITMSITKNGKIKKANLKSVNSEVMNEFNRTENGTSSGDAKS